MISLSLNLLHLPASPSVSCSLSPDSILKKYFFSWWFPLRITGVDGFHQICFKSTGASPLPFLSLLVKMMSEEIVKEFVHWSLPSFTSGNPLATIWTAQATFWRKRDNVERGASYSPPPWLNPLTREQGSSKPSAPVEPDLDQKNCPAIPRSPKE